MHIVGFILSILLALLSGATLAYISIATMIGPWIAPTIVLIAGLVLRLKKTSSTQKIHDIALIQTVGSVSGIVATGIGFTLPTLYFLDKPYFESLLKNPLSFSLIIGLLIIAGGSLGILLARSVTTRFLNDPELSFPVSQLIYKTITSQTNQIKKLLTGLSLSSLFCLLRDGFSISRFKLAPLIPWKEFFVFPSLFKNTIHIVLWPMLWAIGFIAGISITLPLLVGLIAKYLVLYPLNHHALITPFSLFQPLDDTTFTMSFCSGLIIAETIPSLLHYPSLIWHSIKQYTGISTLSTPQSLLQKLKKPLSLLPKLESFIALSLTIAIFSYFQFPILAQFVMILLTILATYQINYLGSKIGLIQFGRFTTFVMIPTMLLFPLTALQTTILCVFVSICFATSSDLLFNYKIGELCNINIKRIYRYQWLGLIITALSLGTFLWLLFTNLHLGTSELFAQRAKARAILIQFFDFNWTVMIFGALFGFILKKLKVNPLMVLGGILMPNSLTLGLVFGAIGSLFTTNKHELFPFFSGIFTGESLWLIISIIIKLL